MKESTERFVFDFSRGAYYIPHSAREANDLVLALPNGGAKYFTYAEVKAYVEGWIEYVPMTEGIVMVVNEEGLLFGLPINPIASMIAQRKIVGNVLISPVRLLDEDETE